MNEYGQSLCRPLIFSIAPQWVSEIIAGRKSVELRRRSPALKDSTPALIYETRPSCRIRVRCNVGPVLSQPPDDIWRLVGRESAVSREMFDRYFSGSTIAHAIIIKDVADLGTELTLDYLKREYAFRPPQSWCYLPNSLVDFLGSAK